MIIVQPPCNYRNIPVIELPIGFLEATLQETSTN